MAKRLFTFLKKSLTLGVIMTIQSIKKDIEYLKEAIKPKAPKSVVMLHDEAGNIVDIHGLEVTGCTQAEIEEKLKNVSVFTIYQNKTMNWKSKNVYSIT